MTTIQLVVKRSTGRGAVLAYVDLPDRIAKKVIKSLTRLIDVLYNAGPWEEDE